MWPLGGDDVLKTDLCSWLYRRELNSLNSNFNFRQVSQMTVLVFQVNEKWDKKSLVKLIQSSLTFYFSYFNHSFALCAGTVTGHVKLHRVFFLFKNPIYNHVKCEILYSLENPGVVLKQWCTCSRQAGDHFIMIISVPLHIYISLYFIAY